MKICILAAILKRNLFSIFFLLDYDFIRVKIPTEKYFVLPGSKWTPPTNSEK